MNKFFLTSATVYLKTTKNYIKKEGGHMSIRNVAVTVMQLITATGFATLLNLE